MQAEAVICVHSHALGHPLARFLLKIVDFTVFHSAKFEDAQNASGEILMTYDCTRNPSTLSGGRLITVLMLVSMLPMMSWRGPFRQSALA